MHRLKALFLTILGVAALASAPPASAVEEYFWQRVPQVGPHARSRLDYLSGRAMGELRRAGPLEPREIADLADALSRFGYCRKALQVYRLRPSADPDHMFNAALAASVSSDRACARAMLSLYERTAANWNDPTGGFKSGDWLYRAGALWRRFGEEERGLRIIRQAEARHAAHEQSLDRDRDGRPYEPFHCCPPYPSPTWRSRFFALRIYHGSPLHDRALRAFADEALAMRPPYQAVLEELSRIAAIEGYRSLADRLAEPLRTGEEAQHATAYFLLTQGRYQELVELLNSGLRIHEFTMMPRLIKAAPDLLYENRARIREWQSPWDSPRSYFALADHFIDSGEVAKARDIVAEARIIYETAQPHQLWQPGSTLDRLLGYEVLLGVARTDPFETIATARERVYSGLAVGFARAGRWPDFDRAMSLSRSSEPWKDEALFTLPCHFAQANPLGLQQALARSRAHFETRQKQATETERAYLPHQLSPIARCLRDAGKPDRALAVMEWIGDPESRFDVLARVASDEFSRPPFTAERRLIRAAFRLAERHDLWGHEAVPIFAAGVEQVGEAEYLERLLDRIPGPAARVDAIAYVMDDYCRALAFDGRDQCARARR
jgi:hypothetical protein